MKTALLSIALMLAASGTPAQTVFTTVGDDGQKTFSDRPEPAPAVSPPRHPAGTMAKGSRSAAAVNLKEAERRLALAQSKRSHGIDPLPGERSRAGGASTVNHRYWQRQESLRLDVERAQQRLNSMRAPQLARR